MKHFRELLIWVILVGVSANGISNTAKIGKLQDDLKAFYVVTYFTNPTFKEWMDIYGESKKAGKKSSSAAGITGRSGNISEGTPGSINAQTLREALQHS